MEFKVLDANGIKIRTAIEGEGPLVLMVHGWPESWYSWRHQIPKISKAGYTAAAIDVRGYGESDKPHEINAYSLKNISLILNLPGIYGEEVISSLDEKIIKNITNLYNIKENNLIKIK